MIFGLDLATRRVAIACPEIGWVWRSDTESARDKRTFKTETEAGVELGRRALAALLTEELASQQNFFLYERPFVRMNARTAVGQALSAGALIAFLPGSCVQIDNNTWKKDLCGLGSADKDDIRTWLEDCEPSLAALSGSDQDLIDATCIALYGGSSMASALGLQRLG